MKRSQRMQPVVGLAARQEQAALDALGRARGQVAIAEDKLRQLRDYRDEYRAGQGDGQVLDLSRLQAARYFLARLDDVIRQQGDEVRRLEAQAEHARQSWLQARRHHDGMKELAERYRQEEMALAARQEQARADDMSGQRLLWRRRETALEPGGST